MRHVIIKLYSICHYLYYTTVYLAPFLQVDAPFNMQKHQVCRLEECVDARAAQQQSSLDAKTLVHKREMQNSRARMT